MKSRNTILFVLFVFLAVAAWAGNPPMTHRNDNSDNATMSKTLDPGDIVKDSDKYMGQTVTVAGTVNKMYADGVFTMKENKAAAFRDLLVIIPRSNSEKIKIGESSTLTITGQVEQFSTGDLSSKYGFTDIKPDLLSSFNKRPVLVVSTIVEGAPTTK